MYLIGIGWNNCLKLRVPKSEGFIYRKKYTSTKPPRTNVCNICKTVHLLCIATLLTRLAKKNTLWIKIIM